MNHKNSPFISEATTQWLISYGYSVENLNQHGENGDTPLMKATKEGNRKVVKELIDIDVDINALNDDANNALWLACFRDYYDLIELLLENNININNQNANGATALMYAASAGKAEVVKLLLKYSPNLELQNLDDYRAIDFASNIEVLVILKNV